jgi:hypothetical protein
VKKFPQPPEKPKPIPRAKVTDPCVIRYILDHHGDLVAGTTLLANLQQYTTTYNSQVSESLGETVQLTFEKEYISHTLVGAGRGLTSITPWGGGFRWAGVGVATAGRSLLPAASIVGAVMSTVGTYNMQQALTACKP